MNDDIRRRTVPLWSVAVGGILTAFAFPVQPNPTQGWFCLWPAVFVGLAPFLARLLSGDDPIRASLTFAGPWFLLSGTWVFRMFDVAGWLLVLLPIAWVSVFGWLAHRLHRRGFATLVAWPMCWLAVEFIRSELSPLRLNWLSPHLDPLNFTWFGLGHPRLVWPPAAQSADLIGGYGLAVAPFLVNLMLARWWVGPRIDSLPLLLVSLGLGLEAGYCRHTWQTRSSSASSELTAGVVQSERFDLEVYRKLTEELLRSSTGVELVVWPELAVSDLPSTRHVLQRLAGDRRITLVTGVESEDEAGGYTNRALVVHPDGRIDEVHKRQRVPFVEKHPASDQCKAIALNAEVRLGVAICYDMDMPWNPRQLAGLANVLAMPTLDEVSWGGSQHAQHSLLPRLRAIENRRSVVQAATSGYSQIINPYGEVLAELPFRMNRRPGRPTPYLEGHAAARVPVVDRQSTWTVWGHRAPLGISAVVGMMLLTTFRSRRRIPR